MDEGMEIAERLETTLRNYVSVEYGVPLAVVEAQIRLAVTLFMMIQEPAAGALDPQEAKYRELNMVATYNNVFATLAESLNVDGAKMERVLPVSWEAGMRVWHELFRPGLAFPHRRVESSFKLAGVAKGVTG